VTADAAQPDEDGLRLRLGGGDVVRADRLLVAVGRTPRVAGLGLETLGIDVEQSRSGLRIDDHGRLTGEVSGQVWAAGDVTGVAPFTHTATYQARAIAASLLGRPRRMNLSAVPRAVYTDPAVLCVGRTPDDADLGSEGLRSAGAEVSQTARGFLESAAVGRVQVYVQSGTGVVVGAAGILPGADDVMGQAVLAVRAGLTAGTWEDTVQPFPAFTEIFGPVLRQLTDDRP
jgi:dihydrolipoamide dehydrogenase